MQPTRLTTLDGSCPLTPALVIGLPAVILAWLMHVLTPSQVCRLQGKTTFVMYGRLVAVEWMIPGGCQRQHRQYLDLGQIINLLKNLTP